MSVLEIAGDDRLISSGETLLQDRSYAALVVRGLANAQDLRMMRKYGARPQHLMTTLGGLNPSVQKWWRRLPSSEKPEGITKITNGFARYGQAFIGQPTHLDDLAYGPLFVSIRFDENVNDKRVFTVNRSSDDQNTLLLSPDQFSDAQYAPMPDEADEIEQGIGDAVFLPGHPYPSRHAVHTHPDSTKAFIMSYMIEGMYERLRKAS